MKNKYTWGHVVFDFIPDNADVLGEIIVDNKNYQDFIRIPYGEGYFYLHTNPEVFTNYALMASKDASYLSGTMAYLENDKVWFDLLTAEYGNNKGSERQKKIKGGSLQFIKENPPLRVAYWLLWLAFLLFVLINGKRRQSVIRDIEPLKNNTLAFVKRVSQMHRDAEDYQGIIEMKINHFLTNIQENYFFSTIVLNEEFAHRLSQKSGWELEATKDVLLTIRTIQQNGSYGAQTLVQLEKK